MVSAIRSAYSAQTRFFHDSNDESGIIWYFVPNDTPGLDFPHCFNDTIWDERNFELQSPIGERQTHHVYSKGLPPQVYSTGAGGVCGTPEQWFNGASINDPVPGYWPLSTLPVCCPRSLLSADEGGTAIGYPASQPGVCFTSCVRAPTIYFRVTISTPGTCLQVGDLIPLNIKNGVVVPFGPLWVYEWESPEIPLGTGTGRISVFCRQSPAQIWCGISNAAALVFYTAQPVINWVCTPFSGELDSADVGPTGCGFFHIKGNFFE